MTTSKDSSRQSNQNQRADIAGKFGGQFWLLTLSEIERSRKMDREEIEQELNTSSDINHSE